MRRTPTYGKNGIVPCGSGCLQPRDQCPNPLHDHPLPANYNWAADEAARRLRQRWTNRKCPDCGLYGWEKP